MLLLDEPLSNLDARLRVRMREEIKRIQRRTGITSVFVTHDQEEALSIADRIAVMSKGVLEQFDTPSRIYAQPRTLFVADFIGTMNVLDGTYRRETSAVQVEGTVLPVHGVAWPDGHAVRVAIRPEDLQPAAGQGAARFGGRIDVVMDLGHFRQLEVQLPSERALKVFVPKERHIAPGEAIVLEATRYLVYAGEDAPSEFSPARQPVGV